MNRISLGAGLRGLTIAGLTVAAVTFAGAVRAEGASDNVQVAQASA